MQQKLQKLFTETVERLMMIQLVYMFTFPLVQNMTSRMLTIVGERERSIMYGKK